MAKKVVFDQNNTWVFMLKEYERIQSMMVNEKNEADTRVNFFLTIATASIGVLVILYQATNIQQQILLQATLAILSIQLIYGLIIQSKLTMRAINLEAYRMILVEIQDTFAKNSEIIDKYFEYQRKTLRLNTTGARRFIADRLLGNLSDFVAITNAFLASGITLTVLTMYNKPHQVVLNWVILTFVLMGILLYLSSYFIRRFIKPVS